MKFVKNFLSTKRRKKMKRADYMTASQKKAMGNLTRTHSNCKDKTGVRRPGKTAQDKAKLGH